MVQFLDMYEDTMELRMESRRYGLYLTLRRSGAVVPVRGDGKILMVKQYRNAIDRVTLEISGRSATA